MMNYRILATGILILIFSNNLKSQTLQICNSFDDSIKSIFIDSSSIWEIGTPNKGIMDSSFSAPNSIVTDLINPYRNNDTSSFYIVFKDTSGDKLPNYLGLYPFLEVEFNHRFNIDSGYDIGKIELSFDNKNWYDLLSTDNGLSNSSHYFYSTNDILYDSLNITGQSNGWINTKIYKDVDHIVKSIFSFPDSLIVKFSLQSDNASTLEGWQIDDICLTMDLSSGVDERTNNKNLRLFPNPTSSSINLNFDQFLSGRVQLLDIQGRIILDHPFLNENKFQIDFPISAKDGLYILKLSTDNGETIRKVQLQRN